MLDPAVDNFRKKLNSPIRMILKVVLIAVAVIAALVAIFYPLTYL